MTDRFIDLLRHGETTAGGRLCAATEVELGPQGLDAMRHALTPERGYRAIVSSPAGRCAGPAERLAAELGAMLELDADLRERALGDWDGRPTAEIPFAELARLWEAPEAFTPPGGEPFAAFRERVRHGFAAVLGRACPRTLVITHGGVIRVILGQVLDLPANSLALIEVPPACLTRLRVPERGRISLIGHEVLDRRAVRPIAG